MTLLRTDPLRELDRLAQQFAFALDLPGVHRESIDPDVEHIVLSVRADRRTTASGDHRDALIAEHPSGSFSRRLFLGETLDTDRVEGPHEAGVLRPSIAVAEEAKPRTVEIRAVDGSRKEINALSGGTRVVRPMSAELSPATASDWASCRNPTAARRGEQSRGSWI